MADRSPAHDGTPHDDAPGASPDRAEDTDRDLVPTDDDEVTPSRSLFERWWWQSFMVAVIGLVVIGFQWDVISTGEAIIANWLMVVLGAGAVVVGVVLFFKDRPTGTDRDA